MKRICISLLFSLIISGSLAQSFIGLSAHNNQYSFLSKPYNGDFNNVKNNKLNISLLFKQQLFKYMDICVELGYERAKIEYDIHYRTFGLKDNLTTEPVNLITPVYLQPKFRFKNLAIHLNGGIAPQYLLSHKTIRANDSETRTEISTILDNRYNYSFVLGGGLDYHITNKWLVSLNYFNSQIKKEWRSLVGYAFNDFPMIYKNDRLSLSLAYNLTKKK